jgi:Putative MetA-pathway of phenol degradation
MRSSVLLLSAALSFVIPMLDGAKVHAQPTTDARDYEGAGGVPSGTMILLDYLRHQTTAGERNLTTNLNIFRATYVLRFGKFAFVPFDALLPVADADLKVYTNPAMPTAPPTQHPQGNPIAGSIRNTGFGDIQYLPAIIYDHVENKEKQTHTYAGFNLYLTLPTGNYASKNALNIGENRWTLKPQLALGQRFGKVFTLELVANMVFYSDNTNYKVTSRTTGKASIQSLRQEPTINAELHFGVDLAPHIYVSASYYAQRFGDQFIVANNAEVEAGATVHTMRFNWGVHIEKQTLLLLQLQQDLRAGGAFSNTRYVGMRVSHFWW